MNGKEETQDDSTRLDLIHMSPDELANINFFFGGSGDCRHIYTTLIDLHKQCLQLPLKKQNQVKCSFVINDLKPHPMAKMLIMLSALRKLSEFDYEAIGKEVEATKAAAVLMYLFGTHLMPGYICKYICMYYVLSENRY